MSRRVEDSMADAQRSDDEGCITEDFSDSRGSSETKENIGEVREHPAVNRCQEQSCQASKQIETILKVIYLSIHIILHTRFVILFPYLNLKLTTFLQYLGDIDEEFTSKSLDLKSCIQNLEEGFLLQLEGMTRKLEENETKYNEDFRTTQEKISAINDKVVETRQIIGGASASSKVRFWIMISKRILY